MKYHHIGIPTDTPQNGEVYLDKYKLYCTDHENNPYGIQWMRYEKDCNLPDIVKSQPHIAFKVDDLDKAIQGKQIIIKPNSPSKGVRVAFILENGAPVEFLEYTEDES